ncbi:hypothetical protein N7478_004912 [Penicillium angulare]|uniref:uncharacterized protein n=1 Tax=Penicillium angulare TaxID=116970 RepID=UPI0025418D0A|nr:uncharacterized protein N7478_004912 [Penicillium angulare]KAJ5279540.1 hypothetical protein N7478_004912 [Penicillium angulare]
MPPPLPSSHRGMTANPLKPVGRYRPGKAVAEEHSSSEEEVEEDDIEAQKEQERRQAETRRKQQAPKASSFPSAAARKAVQEAQDEDEEGFVTEDDDEEEEDDDDAAVSAPEPKAALPIQARPAGVTAPTKTQTAVAGESEEEDDSSEEESSSEDEAPRRMLIRPTFIKKDKRNQATKDQAQAASVPTESTEEIEARRAAQRQEKADQLVRDQLEKDAIARSSANKAWDDDDDLAEADDEAAIDDKDGVDPDSEYAAWKLRELKRVKREREAIEEAEKEREEIERRRNLTQEDRDREDAEFIAQQKEDREATRGQGGFMQRYFHKGAFFRGDLEKEGLDERNVMGRKFVDDVARDTLPQYMQIRDMTKLGKKGRTRYRDLRSEDTGRFGEGYQNRRGDNAPPIGVTDERFMPDRGDDRGSGPSGPTGANASFVRSRWRSRSRSPRKDSRDDQGGRSRSRERRKRSPSPYDDRDKRRRVDSSS